MHKADGRLAAVKRLIAAENQQSSFKRHCDVVVEGPVSSGGVGPNRTPDGLQTFNTPFSRPFTKQV